MTNKLLTQYENNMIVCCCVTYDDRRSYVILVDLDKIGSRKEEFDFATAVRKALNAKHPYTGEASCSMNTLVGVQHDDKHPGMRPACIARPPCQIDAIVNLYADG